MIAAVDVDYREGAGGEGAEAVAACVLFRRWEDAAPAGERTARVSPVAPYVPGRFYERELPCVLAVLKGAFPDGAGPETGLQAVVVDGYAWLGEGRPGLGARLSAALGVPVVGVAKSPFRGAPAVEAVRAAGVRPLYVTAAGMDAEDAARLVRSMHGPHRLPTLLKRVDRLCRDA